MGRYVAGNTPLHRLPAAAKFIALVTFVLAVTIAQLEPWEATLVLVFLAVLYAFAQIPFGLAMRQLAPVVPFLVALSMFVWWQNSAAAAWSTGLSLGATLAAANLLTLTTTIDELLSSLEHNLRPLARIGLPVEAVSLAISLTIRMIPVMLGTVAEVLDARKARGAGFSIRAFGTPLIIRSIRRAERVSEALLARGAGD
ncbi:Energy-coupling factor transporter transmembrane protein BioN [Corynebacterium capitovis DSM 44611]|uniref:energy-coupling factor transporter transmembrane component T family protein n=1 Tax=Corynebacterium capitovis TaxID=131081 RepID=UPI00058C5B39|nr:energy-coupling factor transporter transmembrane protein EcfT [Corynebacterium capitovis]WKD57498.1 Energy-coupling factor transporter transmembrane protein BioN [Corynebacterium capitovis DSM 44611]